MTNRALVIGSRLPPLLGTENDAAAMERLLKERRFEVEKLVGTAASRSGILAAYDRLIDAADRDSAAVLYYAGHGGYALNATPEAAGQRTRFQCIFPTDWTEHGEFQAILDVELSQRLSRLTEKTQNATVILDCCHSSELSRGPVPEWFNEPLVPRVYGAGWARLAPEFLAAHPVDLSRVDVESNRRAVRLAATAPDRRAFETSVIVDGVAMYRGLFTWTLERVLAEAGDAPLTWLTIVNRVRELVTEGSLRQQFPIAEGPADRLPFTTQVMKRPDAVVFFRQDGVPCLRANRILGATVGATYDIMSRGGVEHDRKRVVARAKVVGYLGANARVDLEPVVAGIEPEPGALGFPTRLPYPPLPIWVTGDGAASLVATLRRPAPDGEQSPFDIVQNEVEARFEIQARDGKLALLDAAIPAGTPLDDNEVGRALLVKRLERWSKAEAVRALVSEGLRNEAIDVGWGRVEHGRTVPVQAGSAMHVDDWIYMTVKNCSDRTLYVAIFDIGIAGKVTLLTVASPNGRGLEPGRSFTLGQRDGDPTVRGLGPISWPDDVPKAARRRESLLVIAASAWTDFRRLETEMLATRSATSRLEAALESFRRVRYRDLSDDPVDLESFCVHRIDFDLVAQPR